MARLIVLPGLILAAALSVTWLVWDHERQATRKELRSQFDFSLREAVSRVEQRMAAYVQMLRGVQGLFATTDVMDRDALHGYVGALNLDANFSGIQSIGVATRVSTASKEAHVAAMRRHGFNDYAIRPEGLRETYAPVTQREPNIGRNRVEPGFDPWTDPVRRLAMEQARDSGMAAVSGNVRLAVDTEAGATPGFILYLPIYARGQPHDNVAQRREHLVGWVFASFRMSDLMASLYGEQPRGLAFAIYNGVEPSDTTLLYRSAEIRSPRQKTDLSENEYMVVAGRNWTLSMSALDDFETRFGRDAAPLIASAGTGLGLLLALLAWLLATGRARALQLAAGMTRELRESEQRWAFALEGAGDGVWDWNLQTRAAVTSRRWKEIVGVGADTIDDWESRIHPEAQSRVMATLQNYLRSLSGSNVTCIAEYRIRCDDGLWKWVLSRGMVVERDAKGRPLRMIGTLTDISERKHAEEELRVAAAAFESQEAMMITDANRVILRVNRAFTEITGYTAESIVGQTPRVLQSGRHDAAFFRAMWETIHRTGGWQGEIWDRRKSGEVYPKWLTISAVKDGDGTVTNYIGTHHDITDRKKAETKIEELAFFDPLTHLPNRTLLRDRLKQAITVSFRNETCGAVMFIDLDHFKTLNDTLGHDKGDLLLQQVAQRLAACVREGDTVARLGGDEFVVVLESLNRSPQEAATQVTAVGEKILAALNQTYQLADIDHRSTASIGATLFYGQEASIDDLLKQADLAMYKAKETGRNTLCFFDPVMQSDVVERASLESGLRRAIQENQFVLHYQAQVVGEGRVIGAEVLVRWQHPERGEVPPAEFISLAEETGLILPLGHWVLETACTQLALWGLQPELAHLTVAVNVSARQFREPDFVAQVLAVLSRTGADPNRLKIELTESLLVDNVQGMIEKMYALKARGVSFSLDDFGTGYSSLSYLKRMPLDQLKIDQSFVRDVLIDPNDAAIARTIVALAQSLGLGVIAEGVETQAQRDFLSHAGCHAYQGYFFSRPLPVKGFEAFARGKSPHYR